MLLFMKSSIFPQKFHNSTALVGSNKSPEISKDLHLNIKSGKQILSKALEISKNTARTSFSGSQLKFEKTSWFTYGSWIIQESNG